MPADPRTTDPLTVAVVGAGPYGLALAARCAHLGIPHTVFGEPMGLWHRNMPPGMLLRSHADWHLDPQEDYTIERYAAELGTTGAALEPIELSRYLDYAERFQRYYGLAPDPRTVARVDHDTAGGFVLTLSDEVPVRAANVVVATGLGACAHVPPEIARLFPAGRVAHCSRVPDVAGLAGLRCLVVGGRQSAFEWTALAAEHGAAHVHLSCRHPLPGFRAADWSWTAPLLARFETEPRWYHELPRAGRDEITQRMWRIGRHQLEPWLGPRIDRPEVSLWPDSVPESAEQAADGSLRVRLSTGAELTVDTVLMATGYRMDVARLPFLTDGDVLASAEVVDGVPVLDEYFRSLVPGLYFTSKFATRDFGNFFDFTAAVRVSARAIAHGVRRDVPETSR